MKMLVNKKSDMNAALNKYAAINTLIEKGGIKVDRDKCSCVIKENIWIVQQIQKTECNALANILWYINFTNAADQKECHNSTLFFSIEDTDIKGRFIVGNFSKGTIKYD